MFDLLKWEYEDEEAGDYEWEYESEDEDDDGKEDNDREASKDIDDENLPDPFSSKPPEAEVGKDVGVVL